MTSTIRTWVAPAAVACVIGFGVLAGMASPASADVCTSDNGVTSDDGGPSTCSSVGGPLSDATAKAVDDSNADAAATGFESTANAKAVGGSNAGADSTSFLSTTDAKASGGSTATANAPLAFGDAKAKAKDGSVATTFAP